MKNNSLNSSLTLIFSEIKSNKHYSTQGKETFAKIYSHLNYILRNNIKDKKNKIIILKKISKMFYGCASLIVFDIGKKFNTFFVRDMSYIFYGCSKLMAIKNIKNGI